MKTARPTEQSAAEAIKGSGLIAIIRGDYSESQVSAIAETLSEAGVTALEVTLNSAGALRHLELIQDRFPQLLTGVGTVRTAAETSQALAAGAHFLVSPNFDPDSIALSQEAGVLHLPGVFTASEAQAAYACGCGMVKLFPAEVNGPAYLKSLRAPLDQIDFIPTGGITPLNVADYVAAGAVALGVGSALVGPPGEDPGVLAAKARSLVTALAAARGGSA